MSCGTFEYVVEDASCKTFFAKSVTVGKIEAFAFDVDEIACFMHYESTVVAKVAVGPLVVIATEEVDTSALLGLLA